MRTIHNRRTGVRRQDFYVLIAIGAVSGFTPDMPALHAVEMTGPGAVCAVAGPDPYLVALVPTAHANGATGQVQLRFVDSPFGVALTGDGHHLYDARVTTKGLNAADRVLVAWAATPTLEQVAKLGALDAQGSLAARIAFNKFLVFVTAEPTADVERWSGPIVLRGISPSGRMHTMAGHGPFAREACMETGFGPGRGPEPDATR